LVRALAAHAQIVGVELDRAVIAAARRHFSLDALDLEIRCEDALHVLMRERRRFDLIVEDCFVGRGDAERKPDWLPQPGLTLAVRRLAPGGILVVNTLDETAAVGRALAALLPHRLELRIEGYENRVLAASTRALTARSLRAQIARNPVLGGSGAAQLRLRTRA
jgi:spermidine synthase